MLPVHSVLTMQTSDGRTCFPRIDPFFSLGGLVRFGFNIVLLISEVVPFYPPGLRAFSLPSTPPRRRSLFWVVKSALCPALFSPLLFLFQHVHIYSPDRTPSYRPCGGKPIFRPLQARRQFWHHHLRYLRKSKWAVDGQEIEWQELYCGNHQ